MTAPDVTPAVQRAAKALHDARGLGEIGPEEDRSAWAASLYGDDMEDVRIVLAAALDVEEMARVWHEAGNGPGSWERASERVRERALDRATALRAAILGGAA